MKHRTNSSRVTFLGTATFLAGLLLWTLSGQASARDNTHLPSPGEITGTITLNGCSASDVRIRLRATPLVLGLRKSVFNNWKDHRRAYPRWRVKRNRVIRAEQTGDQSFVFRFRGLTNADVYRIGIKVIPAFGHRAPPNPCGDLVWDGLQTSMAVAGGSPLGITGTAIQGSLRVFNAPPDSAQRRWPARWSRRWSRAGVFDFTDLVGATPRIRWTPPAGVSQGMMQISLERFDRNLGQDNCEAPEGLIYEGDVNISDLKMRRNGSYLLPAVDLSEVIVPPAGDGTIATEIPQDVLPEDLPVLRLGTVTEGEYQKILLGKPLYVRVIPVANNTPACNLTESGVPPWVILALLDAVTSSDSPPLIDDVTVAPFPVYNGPVVYNWPNHDHLCLRTTEPHVLVHPFFGGTVIDAVAKKWEGLKYGQTLSANNFFCWKTSKDSGGFDPIGAFTEIVGGVLSPFEWVINGISGAWASVKKFAVDAVKEGMWQLGIPCDPECNSVLTTGLEIGLVAAGLPPSLPNFDQLKQQGLDYIASQVASQTGLPPEVTEAIVNKGYKELASEFTGQISNARGSGIPGVDWAVWDGGIEPATLNLQVERSASGVMPTALYIPGNTVYSSSTVPLPKVFVDQNGQPGADHLNLNIALVPNLSGWQQPGPIVFEWMGQQHSIDPTAQEIAVSQKKYWKKLILQNQCVPFSVNRNFWLYGFWSWLGFDTIASYPGVPVLMSNSPPHLQVVPLDGLQICQP